MPRIGTRLVELLGLLVGMECDVESIAHAHGHGHAHKVGLKPPPTRDRSAESSLRNIKCASMNPIYC
jgi:hypothetical protein